MATGLLSKADHHIEQKIKHALSTRLGHLISPFEKTEKHHRSVKHWSNEVWSSQCASGTIWPRGVRQQVRVRSTTVNVDAGTWSKAGRLWCMLAGRNTWCWVAGGRWSADGTRLLFLWLQSRREKGQNPNTCGNLLFYLFLLQRPFYITSQIRVETPNGEIPRQQH